MRQRCAYFIASVVAVTAILWMVPAQAPAQQGTATEPHLSLRKAVPLSKGGPTPRTPDGHPDFSGVWFQGTTGGYTNDPAGRRQFDPKVTPEVPPSFQSWAAAKIKAMSTTEYELGRASVNCEPRGVPGMFLINPYPFKLVQTPTEFVQLNELNNNWRIVPIDGRPHDPDPDPTFNGNSTGHWEGDTLVIDTIAVDERTWLNFTGWFHSDAMRSIERITRPDMNHLYVQVTVEDPKVLTKPWTSAPRVWTLGHEKLLEYYCTNNQEIEQLMKLKEKEAKDTK